jgi:hypothetical protein
MTSLEFHVSISPFWLSPVVSTCKAVLAYYEGSRGPGRHGRRDNSVFAKSLNRSWTAALLPAEECDFQIKMLIERRARDRGAPPISESDR